MKMKTRIDIDMDYSILNKLIEELNTMFVQRGIELEYGAFWLPHGKKDNK